MAARKSAATPPPDDLSPADKQKLWTWARKEYPWMKVTQARWAVDECLDYWRGEGRTKANWLATCRNSIRNGVESGKIKKPPEALGSTASPESDYERRCRRERQAGMREAEAAHKAATPLEIEAIRNERKTKIGF